MLSEWGLWNNSWMKNLPVVVHLLLGGKPQASCTPHSGLLGRAKNFEYFLSGFYTTIITIVIYLKIKRILKQDFFKNNILRNTNQVLQDSLLSAAELLHQVTIMLHITDTCPCSPSSPLFT